MNVASFVLERARDEPDATAIHYPDGRRAGGRVRYARITNRELDVESDSIARGLESAGIGRGVRTALMVRPSLDLFALFDPALGMSAVVPDMDPTRPGDVDPRRIIEAAEEFGATNMFGSPALLDTVGRYGAERGVKLSTLRRVISAGAPVPAEVMERFLGMLPEGSEILTPYGATECLPVSCIAVRAAVSESTSGLKTKSFSPQSSRMGLRWKRSSPAATSLTVS